MPCFLTLLQHKLYILSFSYILGVDTGSNSKKRRQKVEFNTVEERLIVAVDLEVNSPIPRDEAITHLHHVCDALQPYADKGLVLKVNTLARIIGATAIEIIHDHAFNCFMDLKLFDVEKTLLRDAAWLQRYKPHMLTVAAKVKRRAFQAVQELLPDTLVLAVGPLTDLTDEDFAEMGEVNRSVSVTKYFNKIWRRQVRGTVCAPSDIRIAPPGFRSQMIFVTPDIQPLWALTPSDSPTRFTPAAALRAGADAIVVGSGITQATDLRGAVDRTLEEMANILEEIVP